MTHLLRQIILGGELTITTTYTQSKKNKVRHNTLIHAVSCLTTKRNSSCCVERDYVRTLYDYFMSLDDCKDKREVEKIDISYINMWEKFHDSLVGYKRPEDLVVCYLSGPEPQNDFNELVSLGIHPQNIWAFESDNFTYAQAIKNYNDLPFPQPKIVRGSIEQFFKSTPKKFDIVYIDACGVIASSQHALKIISSMIKFHRLNSPGVIITNFALPDTTKSIEVEEFSKLISQYLVFKSNIPNENLINRNLSVEEQIFNLSDLVKNDFEGYYGHFITRLLMDIPSVIIPGQRFANSQYHNKILDKDYEIELQDSKYLFENTKHNSILDFLLFDDILKNKQVKESKLLSSKTKAFINELSGIDQYPIGLLNSMKYITGLKDGYLQFNRNIHDIIDYFEKSEGEIYQFLDLPDSNMFLDLIINQLSYPMHYNTSTIKRYKYNAKKTQMFTDVFVYDECRYIYEWLPTIDLIKNAFNDVSWQYTFRFALDGLIKQRLKYNNEYFYKGSVVNHNHEIFGSKELSDRLIVK